MNVALEYFLEIVNERSIVRAAEKLFITPQNLSNHIKRLEKKYGRLFFRTPSFQLTPAGEALFEASQQLRIIENGLNAKIGALNGAESIYVRIGIHAARARLLLPRILRSYKDKYPQARLIFSYKDVETCEAMLHNGELDVFFGVDAHPYESFTHLHLQDEPIYFVASAKTLKENGVNPFSKFIQNSDLNKFTYLLSPRISRIRTKLEVFAGSKGIALEENMVISDFGTQLILASQNLGACFIPDMFLPFVEELNRNLVFDNKLSVLQIEEFTLTSKISLVTNRLAHHSEYLKGFINCVQDYYKNEYAVQERYQR